jgi:hypothetical protein
MNNAFDLVNERPSLYDAVFRYARCLWGFFLEKTKGGKSVPAKDHDSSSRGGAT